MTNPFETETSPADPWSEEDQPATPDAAVPVSADVKHPFSIKLTLKANESYNAEWINPWVSGATAEEAARNTIEMLNALARHGVIDKTAAAAEYTRKQYQGKLSSGSGGSGGGQRQPSTLPPGVEAKSCQHGEMVYRTGTSAKGPWRAYFCPTPKGTADQCKAIFVK